MIGVYEVYLERSAERDLKKIPPDDFDRVISSIQALANNSKPAGCRKIAGSKCDWRIRVGSYRVTYEIQEKERSVKIMRVRHRKDVYR
ncbi:type II toxin-antitoxin system RelE/ParE family toxin [Candidatus Poribacteria bacterium]|nr:type II toxin-antitoxin system RelE/ParE family toxin [Candidatus Poribacteria bacterium]